MILRPYQSRVSNDVDAAWAGGARNVLAVLPTGAGKCLGKDTPVLMYGGAIKKVQDIIAGDVLVGPDSAPRKVKSVCQGQEGLYRVTPVKGAPYLVNKSHILSLKQTGLKSRPAYPCQHGKGAVINLPVSEYVLKSNSFRHTHKGWRSGVNWRGKIADRFLPPYMLGLWLGDGSSRTASITSMDSEIISYINGYVRDLGLSLRVESNGKNNKSKNYHITSGWQRKNTLQHSLRLNNLILNKHIPLQYKTASRAARLLLLAGIIDTDGALSRSGYDIIFKSEVLANDTAFVARSLGLAAYVKRCKNNGVVGVYHRVSISGDCGVIPVKILYKKAPKRRQKKSVLVTGITVESVGIGGYYGFEIDGDGLFLLGDFTVTHNTVIFAEKIRQAQGVRFAIAHRQELVAQISLSLAKFGLVHSVQASKNMIKWIISLHIRATGRHFYNAQAHVIVSGVRTLLNRAGTLSNAVNAARLWVVDEGHHLLKDNEWGKCVALFPDACKGLGVTATPCRADGKGLGRHAHGVMDAMVEGPGMRDLINQGFLTDYKIYAPETSIDLSDVPVGKTGDYSKPKLVTAVRKSKIVGDLVQQYLRCAPGKLGVSFVSDVETGKETAANFNASGVPAAMVHAKTPDKERQNAVDSLRRGDIKELVNVDIFGEGFDLPAIEVGSFGRPTQSYGLYCQQFGRELRIMDGKVGAIIIDHVGNVMRHGLPDAPRVWTLDAREGRGSGKKDPDLLPLKTCFSCTAVYEGYSRVCPFCGYYTEPEGRTSIEQVDGDLFELSPEVLAAMRGEVERVDAPDGSVGDRLRHAGAPEIAILGAMKNHRLRQEAQAGLRESISWWAGYQRAAGIPDSVSYQMFYARFGLDVMSAKALGRKDAEELNERVKERINTCNQSQLIRA